MFPRHLDLGTLGNSGALLTSSPSLPHHPASAQDHSPLSNIPKWVSWPHPRLSESLLGAASSLLHVMHAPPWALVWLLPPTESSCRTGTHLRTPCTPGPAPYIHRVHSWVFSHCQVQLFATPQTTACQSHLCPWNLPSKYWSGFPFPPPGDLPNPGVEHGSPALQANSLLSELPGKSGSIQ